MIPLAAHVQALHAICEPHTECAAIRQRIAPGQNCYFDNFVYLDSWGAKPIVGGIGLTLIVTKLGERGAYDFSWRNDTDHEINVYGLSALATYSCFPG